MQFTLVSVLQLQMIPIVSAIEVIRKHNYPDGRKKV